VVPAAFSGLAASYILAISRAVGETMILAVARRHAAEPDLEPGRTGRTITSYIVQVALGDLPHDSGYQTIFAAGLCLMLITLLQHPRSPDAKKFREAY
jgi:phosphate transport system permease protein